MNSSRMTDFDGSQLNSDLGLNSDLNVGPARKPRHQSQAERLKVKEELAKWKEEKEKKKIADVTEKSK